MLKTNRLIINWPSEKKVQVLEPAEKSELLNNNTFLEKLNTIFFHTDHFQILFSTINRSVLLHGLLKFPFGLGQHLAQIKASKLNEAVSEGIGFRLLNGALYFPDLFKDIEIQNLPTPYAVNLYYSSSMEPSLPLHTDNTDTLIYQVFGSKRWLVGEQNVVLKSGQCLFVPKGMKHKVLAEVSPSLHFSFALHEETLRDHLMDLWNSPILNKPLDELTEADLKALLRNDK